MSANAFVQDVAQELQRLDDANVAEIINDLASAPFEPDQSAVAQDAQMSRDGGLGKSKPGREVCDVAGALRKCVKDGDTVGVGNAGAQLGVHTGDLRSAGNHQGRSLGEHKQRIRISGYVHSPYFNLFYLRSI